MGPRDSTEGEGPREDERGISSVVKREEQRESDIRGQSERGGTMLVVAFDL